MRLHPPPDAPDEDMMSASIATATKMLARLTDEGVRYCHWKSNSHLEAGLAGATDLDLLFEGEQAVHVRRVLSGSGFKLFPVHESRSHEGMEDFFGVDEVSGRLLHLHVHYTIVVGQRHLKDFRLPWEEEILATRVVDADHGVFIAHPAIEMLLLIVRAAMKIRFRDRIGAFRRSINPPDDLLDEYKWLRQQVTTDEILERGSRLLGPELTELVRLNFETGLDGAALVALRRRLRRHLRSDRTHKAPTGTVVRWAREARWLAGKVNRRYVQFPLPNSRSSSSGGRIIALIGSDGSGKSTLVRELDRWLASKMDVLVVYFGSGDGPASAIRLPLMWIRQLRHRLRPSPGTGEGSVNNGPAPTGARRMTAWRVVWSLALAREKGQKLKKARRARARGFVVLCDRYPQAEVGGMNDGPLLHEWSTSPSRLKRLLAAWEARPYHAAEQAGPDLLLRLVVSPAVALERKSHESREKLELRREVISSLRFPGSRRTVDIDADLSREAVLLTAKQEIWPEL